MPLQAEGRAAPAQAEAQGLGQGRLGSSKVEQSFSCQGAGGEGCWQSPTSMEQKAQEDEGCVEEPQDQAPSSPQCSVRAGCSQLSHLPPPSSRAQVSKCFWSCQE